MREVYGDKAWRYAKPSRRPPSERAHLQGFDVERAGSFAWPASVPPLAQASGESLRWLTLANIPRVSPASERETSVYFVNHRTEEVTVEWLGFDGIRKPYATVRAGHSEMQHTYAGHVWIVSTKLRVLGAIVASDRPGVADIR